MYISKQRRFGYQPVQDVILNEGRTIAGFGRTLKSCDLAHFRGATAGRVPPSPQLRAELVARLGLPIEALFTKDALDAQYKPEHRAKRVLA